MVKEVVAPVTDDSWEMYEAALMLMECDSGAQQSFFHTIECDSCGSKQFGPPLMESHWYDLVCRLVEIKPAVEIRRVGEIVRRATAGVRRLGMRATVLIKIASGEEEACGYPTSPVPGIRAGRNEGTTCSSALLGNAKEVVEEGAAATT